MKVTGTAVTLELETDEVLSLAEFLVRAHRILDGSRSCPIPEGVCLIVGDIRDVLTRALGHHPGTVWPANLTEQRIVAALQEMGSTR